MLVDRKAVGFQAKTQLSFLYNLACCIFKIYRRAKGPERLRQSQSRFLGRDLASQISN